MKSILRDIYLEVIKNKKWRKINSHNFTTMGKNFPFEIVKVGKGTYGALNIYYWGSENEGVEIGNYCSIARGVTFHLGGNHRFDTFSSYPFKTRYVDGKNEAWSKGRIVIKDDVWIGTNAMILSGVTINQGAVIAAGAIVTKDVPAYAVVGGNPAKVIKYRFDEEIREELLKLDFSNLDLDKISENVDLYYETLTKDHLKKILEEQK